MLDMVRNERRREEIEMPDRPVSRDPSFFPCARFPILGDLAMSLAAMASLAAFNLFVAMVALALS